MSEVTVSIHNHHDRILRDLREQSAVFAADPSQHNGARLLSLFRDDLLTHVAGEEHEFYPLIDRILKTGGGRATASMTVDHEFIGEYVDWIEAALHSLSDATGGHRKQLINQLRRYLVQLEAVLNLHFEKEERIYLPMIERHVSSADQKRMLAAMHGAPAAVEQGPPAALPRRRNQPVRSNPSRASAVSKKSVGSKADAKSAPQKKRGRRL